MFKPKPTADLPKTEAEEWRRYWPLVLACAVGFSFHSVMSVTNGIFMKPIGKEFSWGKDLTASGTTIAAFTTILLSPFVGIIIDRIGNRKLALPGLVLSAACVAALGWTNGSVALWVATWLVYGFAGLAIKSTIWTSAVSGLFDHGRGLAIGAALSGTAVAQIIAPPLVTWLIQTIGWQKAFIWLGLGWGGLTLLCCWLLFYDAHDRGLRKTVTSAKDAPEDISLPGLTVAQAWRSTALWQIGISTLFLMFITIGLNTHQYAIMDEAGIPMMSAAWFGAGAGVAGILGKLITGWLLDRYRPNWIGGVTLGCTAFAFLLLMLPNPSTGMIVAAILINGYAAGTKLQIAGLLTSRYGGVRNFGKIFGMMASAIGLGSALGPWAAGRIFEAFGSYNYFMILGVVASFLCGALIFFLPRVPDFRKQESA